MQRFHFNVGDQVDEEGIELADLATAKCEAIKTAGTVICEQAHCFWDHAEWRLTVTDDKGLTLFQLEVVGTEAPAIRREMPLSARGISSPG